jgi:hypothetical protein
MLVHKATTWEESYNMGISILLHQRSQRPVQLSGAREYNLPQWRDVEIYGMQQLIFTVYKAFYD